jgi:uncharacterized SAM-binding protein YcdF (DUF218 family)
MSFLFSFLPGSITQAREKLRLSATVFSFRDTLFVMTPRYPRFRNAMFATFAALLLGQAAYFAWVIAFPSAPPQSCELFVVFGGDPLRVQRGIQMAARMDAKAFVVSDSSADTVQAYLRDYGKPGKAEVLLEPNARHSVQNAWYVTDLVQEKGFRSVVLATSYYHVPRASLLLRLTLLGKGIQVAAVPTEPVPDQWWSDSYLWAEVPKFWGSIGQWVLGRNLTTRVANTMWRLKMLKRRALREPED